jgi:DNA-binding transcriptional ArsR family regulator
LGALAHPIRLDVFRTLIVAGHGGLTPGALIEQLSVPSPKLSFHLKELAIAGLVTQEQAGRNIIYRVAYDQMDALIGFLTENCCKGAPAAEPAEAGACNC